MDPWVILEQALACHKQGNLVQAELLYWQLLSAFPEHGVVNHVMVCCVPSRDAMTKRYRSLRHR